MSRPRPRTQATSPTNPVRTGRTGIGLKPALESCVERPVHGGCQYAHRYIGHRVPYLPFLQRGFTLDDWRLRGESSFSDGVTGALTSRTGKKEQEWCKAGSRAGRVGNWQLGSVCTKEAMT